MEISQLFELVESKLEKDSDISSLFEKEGKKWDRLEKLFGAEKATNIYHNNSKNKISKKYFEQNPGVWIVSKNYKSFIMLKEAFTLGVVSSELATKILKNYGKA